MQVVFEDENEGGNSGRTSIVGPLICTGRISRHKKEECLREFGDRNIGIWNDWRIFSRLKKNLVKKIIR